MERSATEFTVFGLVSAMRNVTVPVANEVLTVPALKGTLVVGQFDLRVQFAREIPRAAGENAALRNDAGSTLAFTGANLQHCRSSGLRLKASFATSQKSSRTRIFAALEMTAKGVDSSSETVFRI